ncbi:MAG: DUF1127 domain-containing protein [Rhizobium sp.]|nr:DUF1127 domain-containing protein [Rhizobium sp.]
MIDSLRHLLNRPAYRPSDNKPGGDVLDRFIRWRQRRQAAEWLRSMPDYLLKDIGISRGEIGHAARPFHEAFTLSQIGAVSDVPFGISRRSRKRPGSSAAGADDTR